MCTPLEERKQSAGGSFTFKKREQLDASPEFSGCASAAEAYVNTDEEARAICRSPLLLRPLTLDACCSECSIKGAIEGRLPNAATAPMQTQLLTNPPLPLCNGGSIERAKRDAAKIKRKPHCEQNTAHELAAIQGDGIGALISGNIKHSTEII